MKRKTYIKMVEWRNATYAALQGPHNNAVTSQAHFDYVMKCAQLKTIDKLLDFLVDDIDD